jgi:hypothetical protein
MSAQNDMQQNKLHENAMMQMKIISVMEEVLTKCCRQFRALNLYCLKVLNDSFHQLCILYILDEFIPSTLLLD